MQEAGAAGVWLWALGALGLSALVEVGLKEVQAAWTGLGPAEWEGRAGNGPWAGIWAATPLSCSQAWFSPSLSPCCSEGHPQLLLSA